MMMMCSVDVTKNYLDKGTADRSVAGWLLCNNRSSN